MRDYYDTLGITPSATRIEIQRAYQRLALKFHPERNAHDPFFTLHYNRVKEAYEVLSDEHKRYRYDKALQAQQASMPNAPIALPPPVITSFFASKKTCRQADALTISWEVLNADVVHINLIGEVASNGTQTIRLMDVHPSQHYIHIDLEATNEGHSTPILRRWSIRNLDYNEDAAPPSAQEEQPLPTLALEPMTDEAADIAALEERGAEFASKMVVRTTEAESVAAATVSSRPERPENTASNLMAYGIVVILFLLIVLMLYILFSINPIF